MQSDKYLFVEKEGELHLGPSTIGNGISQETNDERWATSSNAHSIHSACFSRVMMCANVTVMPTPRHYCVPQFVMSVTVMFVIAPRVRSGLCWASSSTDSIVVTPITRIPAQQRHTQRRIVTIVCRAIQSILKCLNQSKLQDMSKQ